MTDMRTENGSGGPSFSESVVAPLDRATASIGRAIKKAVKPSGPIRPASEMTVGDKNLRRKILTIAGGAAILAACDTVLADTPGVGEVLTQTPIEPTVPPTNVPTPAPTEAVAASPTAKPEVKVTPIPVTGNFPTSESDLVLGGFGGPESGPGSPRQDIIDNGGTIDLEGMETFYDQLLANQGLVKNGFRYVTASTRWIKAGSTTNVENYSWTDMVYQKALDASGQEIPDKGTFWFVQKRKPQTDLQGNIFKDKDGNILYDWINIARGDCFKDYKQNVTDYRLIPGDQPKGVGKLKEQLVATTEGWFVVCSYPKDGTVPYFWKDLTKPFDSNIKTSYFTPVGATMVYLDLNDGIWKGYNQTGKELASFDPNEQKWVPFNPYELTRGQLAEKKLYGSGFELKTTFQGEPVDLTVVVSDAVLNQYKQTKGCFPNQEMQKYGASAEDRMAEMVCLGGYLAYLRTWGKTEKGYTFDQYMADLKAGKDMNYTIWGPRLDGTNGTFTVNPLKPIEFVVTNEKVDPNGTATALLQDNSSRRGYQQLESGGVRIVADISGNNSSFFNLCIALTDEFRNAILTLGAPIKDLQGRYQLGSPINYPITDAELAKVYADLQIYKDSKGLISWGLFAPIN